MGISSPRVRLDSATFWRAQAEKVVIMSISKPERFRLAKADKALDQPEITLYRILQRARWDAA